MLIKAPRRMPSSVLTALEPAMVMILPDDLTALSALELAIANVWLTALMALKALVVAIAAALLMMLAPVGVTMLVEEIVTVSAVATVICR